MAGPTISWTDSHCHLQEPLQDEAELAVLLGRARDAGVDQIVCIGTGLETSRAAAGVASRLGADRGMPSIWYTAGLHPHDASDGLAPVAALIGELVATSTGTGAGAAGDRAAAAGRSPGNIVAVGECGLDYHYDHSPRDIQREVFAEQIGLANRHGLALVVHTREAWDDTVDILAGEGVPASTVIHCFTGGPAEARRCLDLGAYLSFSGIVTFASASEVRAAAELCPAERLLIETDSPFLAPVPHRGRPNEPALVTVVGAAVAALRKVSPAELAAETSANTARVFALADAR